MDYFTLTVQNAKKKGNAIGMSLKSQQLERAKALRLCIEVNDA